MGCGVSRLDANGVAIPARLRPIFLQRLEEIKLRRHNRHLNADSTPSKKELLLHAMDDDDNASHHHQHSPHASKSVPSTPKIGDKKSKTEIYAKENGIHDVANINNNNTDDQKHVVAPKESNPIGKGKNDPKESEIEGAKAKEANADDDDGNERMIGHEDDDAFPGSPSFRVYFKDNGEEKNGKSDAFKDAVSSDDGISPKKSSVDKEEKRSAGSSRKKRSFRKVLPKGGQVKNLLNVKSCYTPSHDHHHSHLLTAKTAT
ncbi:hypothetical protein ACJIZ3_004436 [Penstemon smallii]|uniref:Uncharacterized protein n=1 Tax=Penstemon smallii TaxID=265156 RepID=A0ABD3S2A3_9LAMI